MHRIVPLHISGINPMHRIVHLHIEGINPMRRIVPLHILGINPMRKIAPLYIWGINPMRRIAPLHIEGTNLMLRKKKNRLAVSFLFRKMPFLTHKKTPPSSAISFCVEVFQYLYGLSAKDVRHLVYDKFTLFISKQFQRFLRGYYKYP